MHILNAYPVSLEQTRLTYSHNSLLACIKKTVYELASLNTVSRDVFCNLPGKVINKVSVQAYILLLTHYPDLVLRDKEKDIVYLMGITVPLEPNMSIEW